LEQRASGDVDEGFPGPCNCEKYQSRDQTTAQRRDQGQSGPEGDQATGHSRRHVGAVHQNDGAGGADEATDPESRRQGSRP